MSNALRREDCALVAIDFQRRLAPAISGGADAISVANRLVAGARLLQVPVLATEQSPDKLGATVDALELQDAPIVSKTAFDATRADGFLQRASAPCVLLMGFETHICVLQTALGLLGFGRRVVLVADAVGSRRALDREAGLRRLEREGCEIITAEMAHYEWLGDAGHPRFKEVLALVK